MVISVEQLKSRTEFKTDREYQSWTEQLFKNNNLDNDYGYSISVDTGLVKRHDKMKLTPKKISKSNNN